MSSQEEMQSLLDRIASLKRDLGALRSGSGGLLPSDLQRTYDIELTYTSNAIEGNTLTLRETADVIEKGVTIGGKQLNEYLEAQDHFDAVQWMRRLAVGTAPIGEDTVTELHRRVVLRSRPDIAGVYSSHARRIAGSATVSPNPLKIPSLTSALGEALAAQQNSSREAFEMHFRLVAIHPFDDGNGRTARLLANLILLRGGYTPVTVGPDEREEYLASLETAPSTENKSDYQHFMHRRLLASMLQHVRDLQQGRAG